MAETECLEYGNPVKALGFALMWHVATIDSEISDRAYRVLARYLYYAQDKGRCWPSSETMAADLGVSARTIVRANEELEKAGYIQRIPRMNTSFVTQIVDWELSPRLKDLAQAELDQRDGDKSRSRQKCRDGDDKNVVTVTTKMSCKEEPKKKNKDHVPQADIAQVITSAVTEKRSVVLEMGAHADLGGYCPECEESIAFGQLQKNAAVCSGCGVGLYIRDPDGRDLWKPPQAYRANTVLPGADELVRAFCEAAGLDTSRLGPVVRAQWYTKIRGVIGDMDAAQAAKIIRTMDIQGLENPYQYRFANGWAAAAARVEAEMPVDKYLEEIRALRAIVDADPSVVPDIPAYQGWGVEQWNWLQRMTEREVIEKEKVYYGLQKGF